MAQIVRNHFPNHWSEARREAAIAAAWLHDVVEDTRHWKEPITILDILEKFGQRVAFMVDGMTEPVAKPRAVRKLAYDRRLAHYTVKEPAVALIKLADMLHNLLDIDGMGEQFLRTSCIEKIRCIDMLVRFDPVERRFSMLFDEVKDRAWEHLAPYRHYAVPDYPEEL